MKYFRILAAGLVLVTACLLAASCNKDDDHPNRSTSTITELIASDTSLSIFSDALATAGLSNTFANLGSNYTVLAPSNTAIRVWLKKMGKSNISQFTTEQITPVILYHVLGSVVLQTSFRTGYRTTLDNYVYEGVKYPTSLYIDLAPSGIKINNVANIIDADMLASNGCIHIINQVLYPPSALGIIINNPHFSTLVAALAKSGIADMLTRNGPITFFAPTNEAFAEFFTSIGSSGVESLSAAEISNYLLYHTVQGFYPTPLLQSGNLTTTEGGSLAISVRNNIITINSSANVTIPNIYSSNGVVYAIDEVLTPPANN